MTITDFILLLLIILIICPANRYGNGGSIRPTRDQIPSEPPPKKK